MLFMNVVYCQEVHDHDHDHSLETSHSNHTHTEEVSEVHAHDHDHDHSLETDHSNHTHAGEVSGVHVEEASGHAHSHVSCEVDPNAEYFMPMRVGALFIILATSAVGILGPIILHRIRPHQKGSVRDWILTAGKFFGTGVIIATAFIHMLPEALERFDSECIGEGWHSYHAFGGLFCLLASFALQIVELAALTNLDNIAKKNLAAAQLAKGEVGEKGMENEKEIEHVHDHHGIHEDGHVHSAGFLENDQAIRNISTLVLELGILMHSIIIGITLGTTDNDEFTVLLIALVFHQFFEGIALGTRINDLDCKSWKKPLLMSFFFICTTPIGVAIGIGVRSSLNPPANILAQAILDSLSAGILLYSAYVSLMSIEINHNVGFRKSSWSRKIFCFVCMYLGAALMAVLGTWA
ncbi:hypothetical protein G6F43_001996 [Rhizopus delemar]|nr:hypothetical protein G6F43_001996 [Rhizopus delemar]